MATELPTVPGDINDIFSILSATPGIFERGLEPSLIFVVKSRLITEVGLSVGGDFEFEDGTGERLRKIFLCSMLIFDFAAGFGLSSSSVHAGFTGCFEGEEELLLSNIVRCFCLLITIGGGFNRLSPCFDAV